MLKITCPRCGASAWGSRLSDTETRITYASASKFGQEVEGRRKAREASVPTGECHTFDTAVQEAIASGRLSGPRAQIVLTLPIAPRLPAPLVRTGGAGRLTRLSVPFLPGH